MPTFETTGTEAHARFSVLIVEPHAAIGQLLATMLELQGHRVHLAVSAAEAHRIHDDQATPLEIVLIDIDLGGMCPSDFVRRLSVEHPGIQLLTVGVEAGPTSPDWAGVPGFRGHLQMPFHLEGLAALIRACDS